MNPVVNDPIPAALLECDGQPLYEGESQKDVAKFIVRLAAAGEDCRTKLKIIKQREK